jgi:hypothetical protein
MFKIAFKIAFTKQNIESGFAKTRIWLYNLNIVLDKISCSESLPKQVLL